MTMIDWITVEGVGHYFFYAFPVFLLILFILLHERRIRFLLPCLLITVVIINPWFFKYWEEIGLYAYWRVLWVIPVVPVTASIVPAITERIGTISIPQPWIGKIGRALITVIGIIGIAFSGTFVYNTERGQFEIPNGNSSKIPGYVVQIAERLLELKDKPKIIAQDPIGVYIRQYSGEIDTLFGRDFYGHILSPSSDARHIFNAVSTADWETVNQFMLNNEYDYLITMGDVSNSPLEYVESVGEYGIYKAKGYPSVVKEKNGLGQIVSITTIDECGNSVNGERGYSTILYEYDDNGYVKKEFHTDIYGNGVADTNGIAGYEREYDSKGQIIMERTLGIDEKPVTAYKNYAEVRWEYKAGKVVKEAYFDLNGIPAIQQAGHVAIIQEWNENRLITRKYVDINGKEINRCDGYARVNWLGDSIEFYDNKNQAIPIEGINLFMDQKVNNDGWSKWYTPNTNEKNHCIGIETINLGGKKSGDTYICQVEVEFKNVEATEGERFFFRSQGAVDNHWDIENVWNDFIWITEAPEDGIYRFSTTVDINEHQADANGFALEFRCDYWRSGSFRIRNIKIEKNKEMTEWTPGI